jgi:hypothetical protein
MPSADQPGFICRLIERTALACAIAGGARVAAGAVVRLRPRARSRAIALLWAVALGPMTVRGQSPRAAVTSDSSRLWLLGGTVMVPARSGGDLSTIGATVAAATPRRLGVDLMLGVVPRNFESGLIAFAARANAAVPIAVGRSALFIPSAGGTLIWADPPLRSAGSLGYNATLAIVLFNKPLDGKSHSTGFRAAIALHRFGGGPGVLPTLEFGFAHCRLRSCFPYTILVYG